MRRSGPILMCCALALACNFPAALSKLTPVPTAGATPTASLPTETLPPPSPSPVPVCDSDALLSSLRADFPSPASSPVGEHSVLHFKVHNTHNLVVWFVDPDIDPAGTPETIPEQAALAQTHAGQVAARIFERNPCIRATFTSLDVIVVDADQNGWFSGSLTPPATTLKEDEAAAAFESVFLRSAAPQPPSAAGNCSWEAARRNARGHFAGSEDPAADMDFYAIVDGRGLVVYAQWIAFSDTFIPTAEMASVLNVAQEMNCLSHPVDQLVVTIVDKAANVKLLGTLTGQEAIKNLDLGQFDFRVIPEGAP